MLITASPGSPWSLHHYRALEDPHDSCTIDPALLDPPKKRRRLDEDMSQADADAPSPPDADAGQDPDQTEQTEQTEDWSAISDPSERRRVQNRLAQRKFRAKNKEQKEERERDLQNQERAASSYSTPEPGELDSSGDLSGLPWGGPSLTHVISAGKEKERSASVSQPSTSLAGVGSPASQTSQGGTSSRVGLQLSQRFARGASLRHMVWRHPAWRSLPFDTRVRPPVPKFDDVSSEHSSSRSTARPRQGSSARSQS